MPLLTNITFNKANIIKNTWINIILFLILFLFMFLGLDTEDSVNVIQIFLTNIGINTNMFFFILLTLILFKKNINKKTIKIYIYSLFLLFTTAIFASYIDYKWLLNFNGFILLQFFFINYLITLKKIELTDFLNKLKINIIILMLILTILQIVTIVFYIPVIVSNSNSLYFNGNVGIMTETFNLYKQGYGFVNGLIFSLILEELINKKIASSKYLKFYLIYIISSLPFIFATRSFLLALTIIISLAFLNKFGKILIIFFIFLIIQLVRNLDTSNLNFDRLPSYLFVLNNLKTSLFGLGIGGYHIYTQANKELLNNTYGVDNFFEAPESDVVFFLGTFGLIGIFIIFFFFKKIFFFLFNIKQYENEKLIFLLIFSFTVLIGIGEDNAVSLIYWLFIGFGYLINKSNTSNISNNVNKEIIL